MNLQNAAHSDNPNLYWEAGNAVLWSRITSFAATYKKMVLKKQNNSPTHRKIRREAKLNFDLWADAQEHIHHSYLDLQYHKIYMITSGGNCWQDWKCTHAPTHISALKDTQGNTTSSTKDINQILEQFFAKLYGPNPINLTTAWDFLDRVPFPQIDTSLLFHFNALITEQVVYKAFYLG